MNKNMNKNIEIKKIDELVLDINNPRFGELYTGSTKEDDLIEYLLFNESAISIAERLSTTQEFYIDKPLLVLEQNGKFLIKDGNRRCAAVKALFNPQKFGIKFPAFKINSLPVVIYTDKKEIENRIVEEHTNNMFREWDRIAKAIEIYRQFNTGSSLESMHDIDSEPAKLIKLASFYYVAVKIGGDNLRKLLRKGRGDTGGKTTIFERLFKYANICGYRFKNKPYYTIEIIDDAKFKKYIEAIVEYLLQNPATTYRDVDNKNDKMFKAIGINTDDSKKMVEGGLKQELLLPAEKDKKHVNKFQRRPQYNRTIPQPLKKIIDECYSLDEINFTNSKIAISRVVFECCLKYVIEETEYNNKKLKDYNHFVHIFPDNTENRKWTNFKKLKEQFESLIKDTGKKKAFENFELEALHQVIHNYNVAGLINDSKTICSNLIPLIEFILESEQNFLNSLDLTKLK